MENVLVSLTGDLFLYLAWEAAQGEINSTLQNFSSSPKHVTFYSYKQFISVQRGIVAEY